MNRVDQVYEDDLVDPAAADREQRPAQPRHVGPGDRAERPLRRRGVLHAVPGHRLLEHDPRALRDRPDHRRERATTSATSRSASRAAASPTSASSAARTRPAAAPASRHRSATSTRSTTSPTRWATSSRGNHTFNGNQLNCSGGNRNAATSVEPGSGSVDHGLRRHLPDRRRAAAQRRRTSRSAASRRSPRTSPRTRRRSTRCRRSRSATSAAATRSQVVTFGPGYAQDGDDHAAERRASTRRRAPPRAAVPRRTAPRSRSRPGRRTRSRSATTVTVAGVGDRRLQRHLHRHGGPVHEVVPVHEPGTGLPVSGGGTVDAGDPRRELFRDDGHDPHEHAARPLGRRRRRRSRASASAATTARSRSPPFRRRGRSSTRSRRQLAELGRRHDDLLLAVPGTHRRQRLGRHRRQRACRTPTRT